jgi:uncharacterized protein YegL
MENTKEIVAKATQTPNKENTKKTANKAKKETPKAETKKETKTVGKTSIYKKDLFLNQDGTPMDPKQKKSKRKSLRRERDNFIAKFLTCQKDPKKVKELAKAWAEYAKTVYMDLSNIFEANTTLENQSSIKDFLKAMNPKVATAKA